MTPESIAYAATWNSDLPGFADDSNPDVAQRDAARGIVDGLWEAKLSPPSTASIADVRRAQRLGELNCPYSTPCKSCGGVVPHCHHLGRWVSVRDCLSCLS